MTATVETKGEFFATRITWLNHSSAVRQSGTSHTVYWDNHGRHKFFRPEWDHPHCSVNCVQMRWLKTLLTYLLLHTYFLTYLHVDCVHVSASYKSIVSSAEFCFFRYVSRKLARAIFTSCLTLISSVIWYCSISWVVNRHTGNTLAPWPCGFGRCLTESHGIRDQRHPVDRVVTCSLEQLCVAWSPDW